MSKSRGNVVDPDDLIDRYGADTVRAYLMFAFKWDQGGPWDPQGIAGPQGFLEDVWRLVTEHPPAEQPSAPGDTGEAVALRRKTHQTILSVTEDFEAFKFNTALARLMELKNAMQDARNTSARQSIAWAEAVNALLLMMAPFTPHIAEELWSRIGGEYSIHDADWPVGDAEIAKEEVITLVVQVNGKVRDRIEVPADVDDDTAREKALASESVQRYLDGNEPKKIIVVPGRLVNIVI